MGTIPAVSDQPIQMSTGLPSTVLPPPPPDAAAALRDALAGEGDRRAAVATVVARWPRFLDAWAELGDHGRDTLLPSTFLLFSLNCYSICIPTFLWSFVFLHYTFSS